MKQQPQRLMESYRSLDAWKIAETVGQLRDRIYARFPGAGLSRVANTLFEVAQESVARSAWVGRPILWLRIAVATLASAMLVALVGGALKLTSLSAVWDVGSFLQAIEAGINDIILVGAGIYFLLTLETRIKRKVVLKAVHELRSLAHIVDTHQLTKDPERLLQTGAETPVSPERTMTAFELSRYLDYCTEMLSLIGKLAALHSQRFDDPVVLDAVDDMEELTNGLSRKIWQKIALIHRT